MCQMSRVCLMAAVLCLVALGAHAASGPDGLEQDKCRVVRAALGSQAQADPGALDSVADAEALLAIDLRQADGTTVIRLETTGHPRCKTFTLNRGTRLVVDLYNTINLQPRKTLVPDDGAFVCRVRTSLFALEPEFVSRVVVDLTRPCAYETIEREDAIAIQIAPEGAAPLPDAMARVEVMLGCGAENQLAVEEGGLDALEELIARSGNRVEAQGPVNEAVLRLDAEIERLRERAQVAQAKGIAEPLKAAEPQPLLSSRPVLVARGPWAAPGAVETRIAELTTELEAVKAAQVELASEAMAPAATYSEGSTASAARRDVRGVTHADHSSPPGRRSDVALLETVRPETPRPVIGTFGTPELLKLAQRDDVLVSPSTAGTVAISEISAGDVTTSATSEAETEEAPAGTGTSKKVTDPLLEPVDIDFRDMELSLVVGLLAEMAQINVVAGTPVTGMVTARLTDVPLLQAMETVLQLNGLGMVEEDGVFHILPIEEVVAKKQVRRIVYLENSQAADLKTTLDDVLLGMPEGSQVSVSANEATNVLILSGPEKRICELEEIVLQLDIAEPALPTVTVAIKTNYAEPSALVQALRESVLSDTETGRTGGSSRQVTHVAADERSRSIIITDIPVRVELARKLIEQLDQPVKQVSIESMIVDAVLTDTAETGVDWFLKAVRRQKASDQQLGNVDAPMVSNLQRLELSADAKDTLVDHSGLSLTGLASQLQLGVLSNDIDITAIIAAQVASANAHLLGNPVIVTVENKPAKINIASEYPYLEQTQSVTGPPMANVEFKDIGVVLEVTPRVTHDDHILVDVMAKYSRALRNPVGDVPIEEKREAQTTLRTKNGQTIFIGGLRSYDDKANVTKVPVLGDIPVLNFFFRRNVVDKKCTELMIFVTCNILPDELPSLTTQQQATYDRFEEHPDVPDAQRDVFRNTLHPNRDRKPLWRRAK